MNYLSLAAIKIFTGLSLLALDSLFLYAAAIQLHARYDLATADLIHGRTLRHTPLIYTIDIDSRTNYTRYTACPDPPAIS